MRMWYQQLQISFQLTLCNLVSGNTVKNNTPGHFIPYPETGLLGHTLLYNVMSICPLLSVKPELQNSL